ncbi:sigma-54-dependent Fis family transcriptional regulator [Stutzerimonas kirkiae]|uniref:Sigma-54-dependent Fis family transcriptional regulator n=1 Tax=Stutzerimonas kirkiae TaxID=2211392 RepID=A0A4Q9QXZ1_9GAMM|nr:sigma-54-dependent Fis family transcriptional regulator [Stutzerimonas kirkiae]TBU89525.1 sigma-54-dependent Fis family transcriptional regulator [Stutzerimonas kirkiae]TBU98489.1 sigma-54-dependent Fis family transcriptional regulator [Stutzerimonas kirkiae]TBV13760.1 sigma-54-dependent Fis family transcriptional regulator [Stutzerimonas kirkiae]
MQRNPLEQHVRNVLTTMRGTPLSGPGSDPSIARSWLRCLEEHQLDPSLAAQTRVLEFGHLQESRERMRQVLDIASTEMNSLHRQLSGAGHAVLLTDSSGVILDCVSAPAERRMFEQAGLWLGADWSEASEGTNGIGTCLVERQPLTIHQGEHFYGRHTELTCSASPVFDPFGELLAVLDVSSARQNVSRQSQFHTTALVSLSAKVIESGYFLQRFDDQWLLRFHVQAGSVGLFSEGLLAFERDGRICAVNQAGLNLLGHTRSALLGKSLEEVFDCALEEVIGRANLDARTSWPLHARSGQLLFAVLRGPPGAPPASPQASVPLAPARPAGELFSLGDARLQEGLRKAVRVLERDVPLLINGETGSGKEAFAKSVHGSSSRRERPFVALNCAAIPESLIESELFGYRDGSFTGARKGGMRGRLQQADGGTLFLDEIGDMPLALQTRLLRVLEDRLVVPIGGEPQAIDVRIISATHRNLLERVADGSFREDLYYRLNGLEIMLPALRDRQDKAQLLDTLLVEAGGDGIRLLPDVRRALLDFQWPGNVRQLRTVLRTLVALCDSDCIRFEDLPALIRQQARPAPPPVPSAEAPLEQAERQTLLEALERQRWHMGRVAEELGVSRNTLYRKLKKHGVGKGAAGGRL